MIHILFFKEYEMYPTIEQIPISTAIFLANLNEDIDYKFTLLSKSIKAKFIRLEEKIEDTLFTLNYNLDNSFEDIKEKAGMQ